MSDDKPEAEKPEAEQPAAAAKADDHGHDHAGHDHDHDDDGHDHDHDHGSHDHGDHAHAVAHVHAGAHGDGHDHGLAHTTPVWLLFAVLSALLVLTIATVSVTSIDLGAQNNLIVAMVIATVKAILVCTFFMHLLWDKKFNLVLFLTSVLFLILFLSMATTDRGEYQHLVDEYRAQQLQAK
jgi:cytochrome c oxidase subunit 4